ncbi:hypothetical protein ACSAZK_08980 [Methanosarcina sp. Mfa9]|uniref:hypothetical protein n=1 Tax=Methanosarcina sp. Mfa9 TaxID=3439063 RepID=UPI003F83C03B
MKNLKRKALIGSFVLILLLAVSFIVTPYLLVGPPSPLIYAHNLDEGTHELRVEVFDSENNSVLDETYELAPDETMGLPKPLRSLIPGLGMDCTFKFTLDGRFTRTHSTNVQPWNTVEVRLYADYAEGWPLSIGESTV